jgi:hypothetical protein
VDELVRPSPRREVRACCQATTTRSRRVASPRNVTRYLGATRSPLIKANVLEEETRRGDGGSPEGDRVRWAWMSDLG